MPQSFCLCHLPLLSILSQTLHVGLLHSRWISLPRTKYLFNTSKTSLGSWEAPRERKRTRRVCTSEERNEGRGKWADKYRDPWIIVQIGIFVKVMYGSVCTDDLYISVPTHLLIMYVKLVCAGGAPLPIRKLSCLSGVGF